MNIKCNLIVDLNYILMRAVFTLSKSNVLYGNLSKALETSVTPINTTDPTQIDSFDKTVYRSAQYTVQVTNGTTNYQVFDALLIHNGTTANLVVINSATVGSSTGALTATVSGGNAILNFTAANAGNQVRVRKVYQTI